MFSFPVRAALLCAIVAVSFTSCGGSAERENVTPVYSNKTGVLERLDYDSNKDGKVDTHTYMDGNRPVRSEIDSNGDGTIDRWEYYDRDGQVERVGGSSLSDGREDMWYYRGPDGETARIERSTKRDGTVNRHEFLEKGAMSRAEEDTDEDGRIDRWERYENGVVAELAIDTTRRLGRPTRRIIYGKHGEPDRIIEEKQK